MGVGVRVTSLFPPTGIWTWQQVPLPALLPLKFLTLEFNSEPVLSLHPRQW